MTEPLSTQSTQSTQSTAMLLKAVELSQSAAGGWKHAAQTLNEWRVALERENAMLRVIAAALVANSVNDYDECALGQCEPRWDFEEKQWIHEGHCPVTQAQMFAAQW